MTLMVETRSGAVNPMNLTVALKNEQAHGCYHWWSHPGEPPAYANLRTPVVLSIATLRAVCDAPITVLDISAHDNDWGHFPEKLRFNVKHMPCKLEQYRDLVEGWPYLSRIFDIRQQAPLFNEGKPIFYSDSDVFWIKNPLPFAKNPERFCFDGWNSGYFYYDPNCRAVDLFHEIFDCYTKAAIYSKDIRKVMKQFLNYDGWYGVWDEMILTYMAHHHPNLFNIIPVEEHSTARVLTYTNRNLTKMFHCNGTMVSSRINKLGNKAKHNRGLIALLVKEFYDNIKKTLNDQDMECIFTRAEMDDCLPQQFSLFDDMTAFLATKDEDGHYHAQRVARF